MNARRPSSSSFGLALAAAAVGSACWVMLAATTSDLELMLVPGGAGMAIFIIGLVAGHPTPLSVAGVPLFVVVVVEASAAADPSVAMAIAVGCVWFVAVELGWEAIERRDESRRTGPAASQRLSEVSTVVAVSLLVAIAVVILPSVAPRRTLIVQGLVMAVVVASLLVVTNRLSRQHE